MNAQAARGTVALSAGQTLDDLARTLGDLRVDRLTVSPGRPSTLRNENSGAQGFSTVGFDGVVQEVHRSDQ